MLAPPAHLLPSLLSRRRLFGAHALQLCQQRLALRSKPRQPVQLGLQARRRLLQQRRLGRRRCRQRCLTLLGRRLRLCQPRLGCGSTRLSSRQLCILFSHQQSMVCRHFGCLPPLVPPRRLQRLMLLRQRLQSCLRGGQLCCCLACPAWREWRGWVWVV